MCSGGKVIVLIITRRLKHLIRMSNTEDVLNECKEFVRGQYSRNTGYNNNTSHNFFKRFTQSRGEWRKWGLQKYIK